MPDLRSERPSRAAAAAAAVIALIAWAGLVANFVDLFDKMGLAGTVWRLVNFFTITTNLMIAVLFTGIAMRRAAFAASMLVAGLALSILLVGVIYAVLLDGLYQLSPLGKVGDLLLHRITPVLVPLFWLVFVPKGRLGWRDPLVWALYPMAYFVYAVVRGVVGGFYPYPFMDVGRLGWTTVGVNAVLIAGGYLLTGLALVGLDNILGRRLPADGDARR